MFRNVLVPVDGSPLAEHAIPWAIAVAGHTGGLHLVHVHVGNLRRKLERGPLGPRHIVALPGVGYRLRLGE